MSIADANPEFVKTLFADAKDAVYEYGTTSTTTSLPDYYSMQLDKAMQAYEQIQNADRATVVDPDTQISYLSHCIECRLRAKDVPHSHVFWSHCLAGQEHRGWFDQAGLKALARGSGPELGIGSWSVFIRPLYEDDGTTHRLDANGNPLAEDFVKLTIDPDQHNPGSITVWKLTDEIDLSGRRLGTWPD